jgi:site-specific DNA recombinase
MNTVAPGKKTSARARVVANVLRLYLRQSVGEDRNTHGIEAQRSIAKRRATEIDPSGKLWAARVEYIDVGYSRDDANRPEYLRLLRETAAGDTVLVWERSRLGVDLDYAVAVRDLVQRRGATVVVASGDPIDATHTGLVMEHMRGAQDGGELRRIRTRTREKLRERVASGYVASPLPYPLETYPVNAADPKSYKRGRKVPAHAAVAERIVKMYVEGAGNDRIIRALNDDRIPPPGTRRSTANRKRSGLWTRSHISDILTNPALRGVYIYGTRGGKGGKFEPLVIEHPEWAIATPELWARVDAARVARATDMPASLNATKHALSGVGRCGLCGGRLSTQTDGRPGKKVTDYQCSSHRRTGKCSAAFRIRKARLEGAILEALGPWFDAAQTAIHDAVREVERRIGKTAAPDVTAIERELLAARAKQKKLVHLAATTDGEIDAVADELREGQASIKRLEAALANAKAPRTDACLIGRQIEQEAVQRLERLRASLDGPDAKDALAVLFPSGLTVTATARSFDVTAEGVLPAVRNSDEIRQPDTGFSGSHHRWRRRSAATSRSHRRATSPRSSIPACRAR